MMITYEPISLIAVFVFYNIARGAQAALAFSDVFKHCNVITFDGRDWIFLDFDRTGFLTRRINCPSGDRLVKSMHVVPEVSAVVAVSVKERIKITWKPWLTRSCNEICRYATGVDVGFTFNPSHLFRKLLKYSGDRNFEVLSAWRRDMGFLGGDNEPSRGEELASEQIEANKQELANKKQSLYQTRLDIIKSQGRESWTPNYKRPPTMGKKKGNSANAFPFGGDGSLLGQG